LKKFLSVLLISGMISTTFNLHTYAGEYIDHFYIEYDGEIYKYNDKIVSIVIDGIEVETGDMPGVIIDSRTLVPAREVFESDAINATVEWNSENEEVYISFEDQFIVLKIDSQTAYVNGQEVLLDVPAMLIRDTDKEYSKTMIPLRFVTESLGYEVQWDGDTYTASALSSDYIASLTNANETTDNTETINNDETVATTDGDETIDETEDLNEQLEAIGSEKANRELPTALANNPIVFESIFEVADTTTVTKSTGGTETESSSEIIAKDYSDVHITSVVYSDEDGKREFIIKADGPISDVDYFIWDSKYIFDITNAIYDLSSTDASYQLTYSNNPIASTVRSSQQEPNDDGNEVLRVVFDAVNMNLAYDIYLSEDRQELHFELVEEKLTSIKLSQNEIGDYIEMSGLSPSEIDSFRLSNPNRIVFDIPNTVSLLGYQEQLDVEGQYVTSIRTAQFDESTTRVVVETDGQADYYFEVTDDLGTIIQLVEPSYDNIKYENYETPTITLDDSEVDVAIEGITYEDNYMDREYIITLTGNYKELFGEGDLKVNDGIIESVNITEDEAGNTKLVIKENGVYIFRVEEEDSGIVIKAYKPTELYSKVIIIDPGHGGDDPGAVANGSQEKDLNLIITNYAKTIFDADPSIKVYYTRTIDEYVSLEDRVDLANEVEADMFICVHNNAYYSQFTGTETWYYQGDNTSGLDSNELAQIYQDEVSDAIGLTDRGIKTNNNLYVLKNTHMPAIIIEGGFLTNTTDVVVLNKPEIQQAVAQALYDATVKTFSQYPT
jgi:N-acetylmuramoyl-L-alanine amidase